MAESEKLQQLDRRIAQSIMAALSGLRGEISDRLREHTDAVEEKLRTLEAILPTQFVADEDIEPLAEAAAKSARQSAFEEMRQALSAMDRSTTQAEILRTLLEHAGGFCSRTALFLTRKEAVRGWGAYGFADSEASLSELRFEYAEGSPWERLVASNGSIELSPADCAPLCSHLESAVPSQAVLIPMVLGDRLAAALYADGVSEPEASLDLAALQSLAFVAAQAIETLAFRQRSHTPTLAVAGDSPGPALSLWGDEAPAASAAPDGETSPVTAEAAEPVRDERDEEEAPAATEDSASVDSASVSEESSAKLDSADWLDSTSQRRETEEFTAVDLEEITTSSEEVEVVAEAIEFEEAVAEEPLETLDTEIPATIPQDFSPALDTSAPEAPILDSPILDSPVLDSPVLDSPTLDGPALDANLVTEAIPISPQEEVTFDVSAAFDEGTEITAPEEPPEVSAPAAADSIDVSEDETVLVQMPRLNAPPVASVEPVTPAAPTTPYRAPDDTLSGTGTGIRSGAGQVEPPSDIDGPGLAFRQAGPGLSKAEDAAHDEGRRLARLLVSEIRLYYEDQVEEGRRNRDIYRRLKEDIDRSRRMYEERIDETVSQSRDYFHEELVRILADGDEGALGL